MVLKVGKIAGDLISRHCPRGKKGSGMLELSITQNFSDYEGTQFWNRANPMHINYQ